MTRSLKLNGNGDGNGRGRETIAIENRKRKPRPSPRGLVGREERKLWRKLWSEPVSEKWEVDYDEELVLDLILLRMIRIGKGAGTPLGVFGQIRSLEDRLLLSPRARRVAGIVLVDPAEPASRKTGGNGHGNLDKRRREQILRGGT